MGMTEKQSLINSITLQFAEEYELNIKSVKAKLTEIFQHYHITLNEEDNIEVATTEVLMNKFKNGKKASGMSDNTLKQYVLAVELLEKYTQKQLCDIEAKDITYFLQDYGKRVSSVTLRAKYQLLSSVFNYLFQHRLISFNPILYIDPPKATVVYKQPMSEMDLEKVKSECEKMDGIESLRDTAIVYTFLSTGCRVSELASIKLKDIDFQTKTCKVLGKGRKERPVALNDKTIYRISAYLKERKNIDPNAPLFASLRGEEKEITKAAIEKVIKKLTNAAKVENVTCHSFRRYYATELRKRNVSIQMIANSLGHANLNQINRYSLYSSNEMLDTVRSAL